MIYTYLMKIFRKIKGLIKTSIQKLFSPFGLTITSRSDFSRNGLKPALIDFLLLESSGILHIGGHSGQEASSYDRFGIPVLWIEANPNVYTQLVENISAYGHNSINALLSDTNDIETVFYLTSNNAESASIFPLADGHKWDGLGNTDQIVLSSKRLDSLLTAAEAKKFEFWFVDVQGAELQVLKGAGLLLPTSCRFLLVEVSQAKFYEGGSEWLTVRGYLRDMGFNNIWEPSTDHEEVLFVNSKHFK